MLFYKIEIQSSEEKHPLTLSKVYEISLKLDYL